MVWGIPTNDAQACAKYTARGGQLMTLGSDTRTLKNGWGDLLGGIKKKA